MTPSRRADALNLAALTLVVGGLYAFNYAVDPFGHNGRFDFGLDKPVLSKAISNFDWHLAQWNRLRVPNVVLGDSRAAALPVERWAHHLGEPAYNCSLGGATLQDTLATLRFMLESGALRRAIVVVGFTNFDATNAIDHATPVLEALDDPLRYYLSPFLLRTSLQLVNARGRKAPLPGVPPMDRATFWKFQVDTGVRINLASYRWPTEQMAQLRTIAVECQARGIDLRFLYAPTHVDVQARVDDFHLRAEYDRTKRELAAMAPVWDYDTRNTVTTESANFSDPFHVVPALGAPMLDEVVRGIPFAARRLGAP